MAASARAENGWLEHYEAAASCPTASTFREFVQQRMVGAGDTLERLRVRVDVSREQGSGSFVANLRVDDAAGGRVEREVGDPSCAALMQALSLVVALSTDESAPRRGAHRAPAGVSVEAERAPAEPGAEWGSAPDPFAAEPVDPAPP